MSQIEQQQSRSSIKKGFMENKRVTLREPNFNQPNDDVEDLQLIQQFENELGSANRSLSLVKKNLEVFKSKPNTPLDKEHGTEILKYPNLLDQPAQSAHPMLQQQIASRSLNQDKKQLLGFTNNVWKHRALRIVYYVSKFLVALQHSTESMKFKLFPVKAFGILNDRASDFEFYVLKKMVKGKISFWQIATNFTCGYCFNYLPLKRFINHFSVIQPDSYYKILWDIFIVFTIVLNIFYLPMKLAFRVENTANYVTDFFLDTIPSWAFLLEIIINFNTAFYKEGKINSNRKSIIINYIKDDFFIDFIVIIPFFIRQYGIPYIEFVLLLRVTRVKSLFDNVEEVLNLREKFAAVIDLIKLIYFVIFVSHFCACAWYYLGSWEESNNNWLASKGIEKADTFTLYINSLYWSTITLLTVGYGDITPVTNIEKIFVIVMAMITCGVFGYAINSIGLIFKEMEEKTEKIRNQMSILNSHLKRQLFDQNIIFRHNLNKQLQLKVRKKNEQDEQVRVLMTDLAPDLKKEVLIDIYKNTLIKSKFFRENLSDECINQLCLFVKEQKFSPDETILSKGHLATRIYFIQNGKVKITWKKVDQALIRTYREGYVIAEKNFILNQEMDFQAEAATYCQLAYLDYEDFHTALGTGEDYERFCLIKDNLRYNPFFKKVVSVCEICSSNHNFAKCPFTFYQPNRAKILRNENESKPHKRRKQYDRFNEEKHFDHNIVMQAALAICLNEKFLKEDDLDDNYLIQLGFANDDENNESLLDFDEPFDKQASTIQATSNTTSAIVNLNTNGTLPGISIYNKDKVVSRKVTISEMSIDQDGIRSNLDGMKSSQKMETEEIGLDKLSFRVDDLNENNNQETTPKNRKKGILKKTSFLPQLVQHDDIEKQRSLSNNSDDGIPAVKVSRHQLINRKQRRHHLLTFKYDRVNSFLNKTKQLDTQFSCKSVNDENKSKHTMKHVLEKQLTNQTYFNQGQNDEDDQYKVKNGIREDCLSHLDRYKIFEVYFPSHNIDVILTQIELKCQKLKHQFEKTLTLNGKLHKRSIMNKQILMQSSYLQKKKQIEVQNEENGTEN